MIPLPRPVADLCAELGAQPGILAVAVGGSRAAGTADAGSDWDLGVYYRGRLDAAALAELGEVNPPGAWGRIMNGGAWLTVGGEKVDVILRDLDVVEPHDRAHPHALGAPRDPGPEKRTRFSRWVRTGLSVSSMLNATSSTRSFQSGCSSRYFCILAIGS